jgi:Uma2 family endonuclease
MSLTDEAWDVVPDLAVEVVSPRDVLEDLLDRVFEYFQAGVRLVWVLSPKPRFAHVYESPVRVSLITESDALEGGNVLPGFRLPLHRLFDPIAPADLKV